MKVEVWMDSERPACGEVGEEVGYINGSLKGRIRQRDLKFPEWRLVASEKLSKKLIRTEQ